MQAANVGAFENQYPDIERFLKIKSQYVGLINQVSKEFQTCGEIGEQFFNLPMFQKNHRFFEGRFKIKSVEIANNLDRKAEKNFEKSSSPYYTVLIPMHFCWSNDDYKELKRLLDIFVSQAFKGLDCEEETKQKTEISILLNEASSQAMCKAGDRKINEKNLQDLIRNYSFGVRLLRSTWDRAVSYAGEDKKELVASSSRDLFAMIQALSYSLRSQELLKEDNGHEYNLADLISERFFETASQVPYGHLRDELLQNTSTKTRIEKLKEKIHYIVGMDADALKLSDHNNIGLFAHLTNEIENRSPDLLSFGYCMPVSSPKITQIACAIDMICRQELFERGFLPYFPEPFIAIIASLAAQLSYLPKTEKEKRCSLNNGHSLENRHLIKKLYELKKNPSVLFQANPCVTTTQSSRMHPHVKDSEHLTLDSTTIRLLRELSQSHLNPIIWATNLYANHPDIVSQNYNEWDQNVVKSIEAIFKAYDFCEYLSFLIWNNSKLTKELLLEEKNKKIKHNFALLKRKTSSRTPRGHFAKQIDILDKARLVIEEKIDLEDFVSKIESAAESTSKKVAQYITDSFN